MSIIEENVEMWLEEKLIPELKSTLNKTECKVQYEVSDISDTVFMARVYLLDLKFLDVDEKIEDQIHIVVKRPALGTQGRNIINLDAAYHNEILFYKKFEKFYNNYPKVFITFEKPPYDSVIVTENIKYQNYFQNLEKADLDTEHIFAALQELAKFHANGYIMKHNNPDKFFELVNSFQNCRNTDASSSYYMRTTKLINSRVMQFLRKLNYDDIFCKKLEIFLSKGYEYSVIELQKPMETLATLCHGDFLSSNIFFKKSSESLQAKLIDFGLVNYGSPCRDVAHFLYLNGTRSHRTDQFFEIFDVYYKSLMQCLKDAGLTDLEQYSKEMFLESYKLNAFFGYSIASVYLPSIFGWFSDPRSVIVLPENEVCQLYDEICGERYTEFLVQMIFDLREAGSLDSINDLTIE